MVLHVHHLALSAAHTLTEFPLTFFGIFMLRIGFSDSPVFYCHVCYFVHRSVYLAIQFQISGGRYGKILRRKSPKRGFRRKTFGCRGLGFANI